VIFVVHRVELLKLSTLFKYLIRINELVEITLVSASPETSLSEENIEDDVNDVEDCCSEYLEGSSDNNISSLK
jgi:hypothetical protein